MGYDVEVSGRAERDLAGLPSAVGSRIAKAIYRLAENPRQALDLKKLKGREGYRLRVGSYRVLVHIDNRRRVVLVVQVGHRRGIYR